MEEYQRVMTAYQEYQAAVDKSIEAFKEGEENTSSSNRASDIGLHNPDEQETKSPEKSSVQNRMQKVLKGSEAKKEWLSSMKETPEQNEKPVRKPKTPEQIRERNITWLLVLGVVFLLISGMVIATSTWEEMGALLKVVTLLGVSVFFLALSGLSSTFLKIEKTAFAFLTLGSLLLPIAIIGIGYFGLFGDYLALTGEGRFWLGVICTLVPLPLYAYNVYKTEAKLFVWIFFIFLSFAVGFLLAAFRLPVDAFFLLIMLFNAGLLYVYHRSRRAKNNHFRVFLKELPAFAQLNLIISTLLMLLVFDEAVFYSFNVLITAFLYMAMVFVYQTKSYQLVFVALFAYGIYQLTDNSVLHTADTVIYALLGASYLLFAYVMREDSLAKKIFYYTSGIISGFAFLYITLQGLIIRADGNSWFLFVAYMVIAGTYVYLAHITKRRVFRWLAPIFILAAGVQFWVLTLESLFPEQFILFLFFYALLLFIGIGFENRIPYTTAIRKSTYVVSLAVLLLAVLLDFLFLNYTQVIMMLAVLSATAVYMTLTSTNQLEKQITEWFHPISLLLAMSIFYLKLEESYIFYRMQLNISFHLAVAGLILLGISLIWQKREQTALARTSFYTGQISYLFAMIQLTGAYWGDETIVRPLILLVGIGVAYWLVRFTKQDTLWTVVVLVSIGFYMSLLSTFSIETLTGVIWFMFGLPVIFLAVERYLGNYDPTLKPYFFYFAQGVLFLLVLTIAADSIMDRTLYPIVWMIPFGIYLYIMLTKKKEWQIKSAFYAGLSMLAGGTLSFIDEYGLMSTTPFLFAWIAFAFALSGIWLAVPEVWKRRLEWYLIAFAGIVLLFAAAYVSVTTAMWQLVVILGLVIYVLYFLHLRKWTLFTVLPLFCSLYIWQAQMIVEAETARWLIDCIGFGIFTAAGKFLFTSLFTVHKGKQLNVDWYSVMALGWVLFAMGDSHNVWMAVTSFLLLAVWFFLQSSRIHSPVLQKVLITLGAVTCLAPYYLILEEYINFIPELVHAELEALPILGLSIILTKKTWSHYGQWMRQIQTVLLIGVTVYLIADAMNSATIFDALIIGILSIISMLAGMHYQMKSYFFVGIGTLLFNVIYQTRPYWGNLPWWVYLLFAGILFIAIASYNEWKKQQDGEGRLEKKLKKIIARFKEWN